MMKSLLLDFFPAAAGAGAAAAFAVAICVPWLQCELQPLWKRSAGRDQEIKGGIVAHIVAWRLEWQAAMRRSVSQRYARVCDLTTPDFDRGHGLY
jgi:hypothetical protein